MHISSAFENSKIWIAISVLYDSINFTIQMRNRDIWRRKTRKTVWTALDLCTRLTLRYQVAQASIIFKQSGCNQPKNTWLPKWHCKNRVRSANMHKLKFCPEFYYEKPWNLKMVSNYAIYNCLFHKFQISFSFAR